MQRLYLLLSMSTLLMACIDTYDVEVPPGQVHRLAIDGLMQVNEGFPQVSVSVTRLFDFTADGTKPPVLKSVELFQGDLDPLLLPPLSRTRFGIIDAQDSEHLKPFFGDFYHLRVETHEGVRYQSTPEQLLPSPPILAIKVDTILREVNLPITGFTRIPYLVFRIDTDLVARGAPIPYLLWKTRFIGFLNSAITLDLKEISLFGNEDLSADRLRDHVIYEKRLDDFPMGYGLEVEQYSLSVSAHDYWKQVLETVNRTGNQFEPAPGIVRGNMQNSQDPTDEVYGFFYASERQLKHIYITP